MARSRLIIYARPPNWVLAGVSLPLSKFVHRATAAQLTAQHDLEAIYTGFIPVSRVLASTLSQGRKKTEL